MFTRILTPLERRRIARYLSKDGERDVNIRQLVMRFRRHGEQIQADLDLLTRLAETYEKAKK